MDRVHLVTLSDRASKGEYQDQSTPLLTSWLKGQGVAGVTASLMPDDPAVLEVDLRRAVAEQVPLILTCGGTGFGPRDTTPEATRRVIEREAPGICELIRAKGGHPLAFASRAVCGIASRSVILNLSGRPAAALEQIQLAWPLLLHAVSVLRKEGEAGGPCT
ncbi:molybdenum cofactor biosynthesis protein [Geothrix oryzae]|jgi:molybdenum cofactor synthesis domain-containing protein|uniref:Molybdenum cofactor biosynthesis protein n=1 Tax=Geothrix oryzae TaxID=2927975 RepID=A0ABM8DRK6_9BACT|nr:MULTISPECIES: MogA/MoaB family molybdenum cofactor biosynthesis protein [Geothrix]BDU69647.1 molybdenum cofactor biosynthesis protein [Geothrix oryzae]